MCGSPPDDVGLEFEGQQGINGGPDVLQAYSNGCATVEFLPRTTVTGMTLVAV